MTERSGEGRGGVTWLLGAAVLLVPLVAALLGSRGPQRIVLNLGPGDAPYLSGFAPRYEIDDKVATHWTTYDARVGLPLSIEGGPVELSYRFSRVFSETAQVEVSVGGQAVDRFECRGGAMLERKLTLAALPRGPLSVQILSDSHERRDRGLKMDWVRVESGTGARVRLVGAARAWPVLLVALILALHALAGWEWRHAALLAAPWSLLLAGTLLHDPWLVHRLLRGVPVALALFGLAGVGIGRRLVARGRAGSGSLRVLTALGVAAFLLRAAAVNHPDFYYPDLRTHARLVETLEGAGWDFFVSPSVYIWEHGVWRTEAYGRTYAFPYTPAFHIPFAVLRLPYDTLLTAMKLTAAAVSVVPLVVVWALARRLGLSVVGVALMAVVPTYTSRLSFAFMPSLLGHAVDMAFVLWLAVCGHRLGEWRVWLQGALFVAACQLAYVSSVVNISVFVAVLAVLLVLTRRGAARDGVLLLGMGLAGSALSVAAYYRDFLGMVADLAPRVSGRAAVVSRYPVQSWWAVAYGRTRDFFDGLYPPLSAFGLAGAWRRGDGEGVDLRRWLLGAWLLTYGLLLLGRARVPDVFLHGHETLFVTPLVCLATGHALFLLRGFGRGGAAASLALALSLAAQGLWLQWRALADQLANAR